MINLLEDAFEKKFLCHVTPYFEAFKPLICTIWHAISQERLTHNFFIAAIHKTLEWLPPEKPARIVPIMMLNRILSVQRFHLWEDLIHTDVITMQTRLQTLGGINGTTIPGITTNDNDYNEAVDNTFINKANAEGVRAAIDNMAAKMGKLSLSGGFKDDTFIS